MSLEVPLLQAMLIDSDDVCAQKSAKGRCDRLKLSVEGVIEDGAIHAPYQVDEQTIEPVVGDSFEAFEHLAKNLALPRWPERKDGRPKPREATSPMQAVPTGAG